MIIIYYQVSITTEKNVFIEKCTAGPDDIYVYIVYLLCINVPILYVLSTYLYIYS